jgi:chromosome partitioning protein
MKHGGKGRHAAVAGDFMRILLIQDAEDLSFRLVKLLEGRGHAVTQVRDLRGLRQIGRATDYDLVLLDLRIAAFDPMAFLESQHRFGQVRQTVLLSLSGDLCDKVRHLGIGEDRWVRDAADLPKLLEIVDSIGQGDGLDREGVAVRVDPIGAETLEATVGREPKNQDQRAGGKVVVVASHKGGTGKSNVSMHVVVGLMRRGLNVACVDLDQSQLSLTRFLENRGSFARSHAIELSMPAHLAPIWDEGDLEMLQKNLLDLRRRRDVVIVDCPAGYSISTRVAIGLADKLVTPINDSFVDLDLLAVLEPDTLAFRRSGPFGQGILEARQRRRQHEGAEFDWIVLRNRLTTLEAHNKARLADALAALSERLDFRQGEGLSERVVYRELFLEGLTLLDLRQAGLDRRLSLSHVAARQELRSLLELIVPSEATIARSDQAVA